jgi:hypothetical protein
MITVARQYNAIKPRYFFSYRISNSTSHTLNASSREISFSRSRNSESAAFGKTAKADEADTIISKE